MSNCARCAGPMMPTDTFCGRCGERNHTLQVHTAPVATVAPTPIPSVAATMPTGPGSLGPTSPANASRQRRGPGLIVAAFLVVAGLVAAGLFFVMRGDDISPSDPTWDGTAFGERPAAVNLPSGALDTLRFTTLIIGSGDRAVVGSTVKAHYVGWRSKDGTVFDDSFDRGEPISFQLGASQVIDGLDRGLLGAQAGERRQLDVPSALAYGAQGTSDGAIGPDEDLTFVVDVIEVAVPSTTTTLTTVATTLPATTTTLAPAAIALIQLSRYLDTDRSTAERLVGTWVPQLSAKYIGLQYEGVNYDVFAVLQDHEYRRRLYGAILVSGADFLFMQQGSQMSSWYFTIMPVSYSTKAGAQTWCADRGLPAAECFPKLFPGRA